MIKTLDELQTFLKICRKQGVTEIIFDGLSVSFGDPPEKNRRQDAEAAEDIQTDEPTLEQLAYYSAGVPIP